MSNETYVDMDRPYIAKQFNGPVISAFIKAVYNFLHKDIDDTSEYLSNLSIETANTEHLLFIGKLMGMQLFSMFVEAGGGKYLTFQAESFVTEDELTYNDGWSQEYHEYDALAEDGVFGTGAEEGFPIALADAQYAAILDAVSRIPSASINSLYAIDTVARVITNSQEYHIEYNYDYPDTVNVNLTRKVSPALVSLLQNVYDRMFKGGTSIIVTRG